MLLIGKMLLVLLIGEMLLIEKILLIGKMLLLDDSRQRYYDRVFLFIGQGD
jgi:hypothetical protein